MGAVVLPAYATNSPTAWNVSPLPPGVNFDPYAGAITGPATMPGVYDIALTAINGDGASTPVTFTIGIEASSSLPPVDAVDLTVDLGTGEVSTSFPSMRTIQRGDKTVTPLFWFKQNDTRLVHVRFTKAGVVWDVALDTLKISLKAFEEDPALVTSNTMDRAATGSSTFYRMAVTVNSTALDGELGTDADDDGTGFAAIAELEWTGPTPLCRWWDRMCCAPARSTSSWVSRRN